MSKGRQFVLTSGHASLRLGIQPPPYPAQATKLVSDEAGWVYPVLIQQRHKLMGSLTVWGEFVRAYDLPQFEQPCPNLILLPICVVDCHQPSSAISRKAVFLVPKPAVIVKLRLSLSCLIDYWEPIDPRPTLLSLCQCIAVVLAVPVVLDFGRGTLAAEP